MSDSVKISIPTTIDENTYTLYRVNIKLPLRNYNLDKRYSDFDGLIASLNNDGVELPYKLPPKSFFGKKFNGATLVESRRKGLETFLVNLVNDNNYNGLKAVKRFLNLPETYQFGAPKDSITSKLINTSDYKAFDSYKWLELFRDLKQNLQEARSMMSNSSIETNRLLVIIKKNKALLGNSLDHLQSIQELSKIEITRRKNMLSGVEAEIRSLEELLKGNEKQVIPGTFTMAPVSTTQELFRGRRVLGSPAVEETAKTIPYNNQELLQVQRNEHKQQDADINELRKIIDRQKKMGIAINEELATQNAMLDELDESIDNTDKKLRYARKKAHHLG